MPFSVKKIRIETRGLMVSLFTYCGALDRRCRPPADWQTSSLSNLILCRHSARPMAFEARVKESGRPVVAGQGGKERPEGKAHGPQSALGLAHLPVFRRTLVGSSPLLVFLRPLRALLPRVNRRTSLLVQCKSDLDPPTIPEISNEPADQRGQLERTRDDDSFSMDDGVEGHGRKAKGPSSCRRPAAFPLSVYYAYPVHWLGILSFLAVGGGRNDCSALAAVPCARFRPLPPPFPRLFLAFLKVARVKAPLC